MFKAITPFATGFLTVGEGNEIYWETSGNPRGKPVVYLHGGPGGGISGGYRRHFDSDKFFIISFEQRGCGRSRPSVTEPESDLTTNRTQNLISDIEKLRVYLGVHTWLLYGSSWGSTLALAYAQACPGNVSGIILAAVCTTTAQEVQWVTEEMGQVFPREWDAFVAHANPQPGERVVDAYYRKLTHPNQQIREQAALAWCAWEDVHVSLDPRHQPYPPFKDLKFALPFAILVTHYWKHAAFLQPNEIIDNLDKIAHIKCILIHGRLDVSSPLATAWKLHKSWPGSEFVVVDEGHGGLSMADEVTKAAAKFVG